MPTTATPRKGVKTITISGITGALVSATSNRGESVETDAIAAYGDAAFTNVPRSVHTYPEMTLTFLDEGAGLSTLRALVGTVATLTLTVKYNSGADTSDTSDAVLSSEPCVVKSVMPGGEVSVDGEAKATVVVTVVKHAPSASAGA